MPLSPYLARLRGWVEHELIMLPGVSACIFDQPGRVLLAHHVDSGIWALPAGAVEPDEDPAAAVAREAREEFGIGVTLQGLIGVYGGPQFRVAYPDGDLVSYVAIVYACAAAGTPAALDISEVDEVRFVAHLDGLRAARWLPSVNSYHSAAWATIPDRDSLNTTVEQFFLLACLDFHRFNPGSPHRGIYVRYLFPSAGEAYDPGCAARAGYTHLLAAAKQNAHITSRLEQRLRAEDPAFYWRCVRVSRTPSANIGRRA